MIPLTISKRSSATERFFFKALWRSTALRFYVEATNVDEAAQKAENFIKRMKGAPMCLEIIQRDAKDCGSSGKGQ